MRTVWLDFVENFEILQKSLLYIISVSSLGHNFIFFTSIIAALAIDFSKTKLWPSYLHAESLVFILLLLIYQKLLMNNENLLFTVSSNVYYYALVSISVIIIPIKEAELTLLITLIILVITTMITFLNLLALYF